MGGQGGMQGVDSTLLNYKIGRNLGCGTFGKVKMAEHILTKQKVAIKFLSLEKVRDMELEERVRREIKILGLFRHPHITRLYEVIETQTDILLVMEYVNCGELFDYIVQRDRLPEEEARRFFQQIISGVEYCHRNSVVHRDLKPENLLLDSKHNIKIADFGLSNIMRDGHFLKTSCGSPNYAAPEVISAKAYAGPEVDVWSCGVILYALLCASLPFDDPNLPNLFKKIKGGIYTLPSHLSEGAKNLIAQILVVDPMKRITISKIQQHSWFPQHLPRYLAVPACVTFLQATKIDEDVLQKAINLGFERSDLIASLQNKNQNQGTVTYNLLLDKHLRLFEGYLGDEMHERLEIVSQTPSNQRTQTPGYRLPGLIDQGDLAFHGTPEEMKWALGLQSTAHPQDIIREVLKVLQNLNVAWKQIGHYTMKCRWFPRLSSQIELHLINSKALLSLPQNITQESLVSISKLGSAIHETQENVLKFEVQ
ncbi:hypothetical protein KI387_012924, partial [Taxus chinensis]